MTATPQLALVLRNGLLLMLSLAAVNRLGLPEGLFLALAILVVLEADLGGGVIAGRERVIGTLMGLLAVMITAGITLVLPLPARVFSGLLLARLFGFAAGLSSGFIVGGHVVAGSLLHHPDNWWYYAFWRTVMTILGVLIGVYVSRQVYSQRSVSSWREQCRSWTEDLAQALLHLDNIPEREHLFLDLRDRRNALRRSLPQLIAEQSVTRSRQDSVRWAQDVLQHCSTVMSCCRDLSALLQHQPVLTPALRESMRELQRLGSERLQTIGKDSSPYNSEWSRLHLSLQQAVEASLLQPPGAGPRPGDPERQRQRLLASRLLLLSDALAQIPCLPSLRESGALR